MTTVLASTQAWTANDVLISDPCITLSLKDLNYATFLSSTAIAVNESVTIKYGNKVVFEGKCSQCKGLSRTIDMIAKYDIELVEFAEELKYKYLMTNTYNAVFILNSNTNDKKTLGEIVGYILEGTGWTDSSDPIWKSTPYIKGTSDMIPSMGFGVCSVYNALNRIIVDVFGMGLWFDYTNGTKSIRYGEYNKNATGYPIPTNIKLLEKDIDTNITGIVVYGDDNTLRASAGSITGGRVIAYRYTQCQSVSELQYIANKIYDDRKNITARHEIEFPAGWYNIREGDHIIISDTLTGLGVTATGHGVKDVKITTEKTVVGIGAGQVTVFDLYSSRLSIIDGDVLTANPIGFDSGLIPLMSAASADVWGNTVSGTYDFEGKTFLGDFIVAPTIYDRYTTGGYTTLGFGTSAATAAVPCTIDFDGVIDSALWISSWKYVEIELTYVFDPDNTATGAEIEWTCVWPGLTVNSDNLEYQSASVSARTLIHRWRINETAGAQYSFPTLTGTLKSGANATLLDLACTITIHYDAPTISGTLSHNVIVQTQIDGQSEWVTLFDYTNAEAYTNAEYNLATIYGLNNVNFPLYNYTTNKAIPYTFNFRCKGSASGGGVAEIMCGISGSYLAFEYSTKIIT